MFPQASHRQLGRSVAEAVLTGPREAPGDQRLPSSCRREPSTAAFSGSRGVPTANFPDTGHNENGQSALSLGTSSRGEANHHTSTDKQLGKKI